MNERRFPEALAVLKRAYDARPSPDVLGRMAVAHMAAGQFTEAQDTGDRALALGGQISLSVRHNHGRGQCFGYLTIGPKYLTWIGEDQRKDTFSVEFADVERIEKFESVYSGDLRETGRGGVPEFRVRAAGKNWRYEYLLYGNGQYQVDNSGFVLYSDNDLQKADSANALILRWLQTGGGTEVSPPTVSKRLEIKKGMTKEEVIQLLGEPARTVIFGSKTTFRYADIIVEFDDEKVVDVKTQ